MAGRPPTPTALKLINGSAKHDPQRINRDEPKPQLGASPPPFLPRRGPAWSAWKRHTAILKPLRVLTEADADALALGCLALAEYLAAQKDAEGWRHAADAWRRYSMALGWFGLHPSARTRIHAEPEVKDDPLEAWASR